MAKTSRYGFYPPISPMLEAQYQAGDPIAQHATYAWQTVYQELAPGMAMREQSSVISVGRAPNINALTQQAQIRADNASERRRVQNNLASTAKNNGDARYHHSMARFNAEDAYVQQQMAIATSHIDTSITVVNSTFGVYNAMAALAKEQGDKNYGILTKNIIADLGLLDKDAAPGSRLHLEFHYGLEPSKGKNFKAGMSMMVGTNATANNEFMVTAILTEPGGRQISATRLTKMIWYVGEGNLEREFPPGYEEFRPYKIPAPKNLSAPVLNYLVLNQLALAAVDDVRQKLKERK